MFSLDAFENCAEAALATDENGRVTMINRAAASLFEVDRRKARGMLCWQVLRLCGQDETPLCGPACAIQKELCRNRPVPRSQALLRSARGERIALDVFTVPLKTGSAARTACLHLIAPSRRGSPRASEPERGSRERPMTRNLAAKMLTARELEVLELLSDGRRTREIAEILSLSVATVRNHVEHIHAKLGVHRRIDAVLLWLSSRRPPLEGSSRPHQVPRGEEMSTFGE